MTFRVGIIGYGGRMGQAIAQALDAQREAVLVAGLIRAEETPPPARSGVTVFRELDGFMGAVDLAIDFSASSATAGHARKAAALGKALVVGTTGLEPSALEALREAGGRVPVLYASNTSLSLAVFRRLVRQAAHLLRGEDYDIAILDRHHRMKKDAPSGTAKTLGEEVMAGNGGTHPPAYAAIRAGSIVGEHEVLFAGAEESISLTHTVTDRAIFARGAVHAALWLHGQKPGFYGMDDVIGLPS